MDMKDANNGQEEMFINQAAHLFLALAGIKPLPTKSSGEPVKASLDDLQLPNHDASNL